MQKAMTGMDAVVHLAAIVGDSACKHNPELARSVNQEASLQLIRLSEAASISRFVFASTCSNYGRTSDPSAFLTEDAELRPISLYAETKVEVEKAIVGSGKDSETAACVLRLASAFGLSPRMRFDLTVNQFTMELLTRGTVVVFGEQFWRPYIHVRDIARAISIVLKAPVPKIRGRVYNVGDTLQNYQKRTLAELIQQTVGGNTFLEYVQLNEDPRDYRVSFDRISRELGFGISRTVTCGVREVAQVIRDGIITNFNSPALSNGIR
jgi:nucleoside-diphosphate-sugar epimerase